MGKAGLRAPVVVLGFGTAAASAIVALREAGYTGEVVVATDGAAEPYSPVLTSYYAGGRIGRAQCNAWADLGLSNLVDAVRGHARAVALDPEAHEVALEGGERLRYAKLLVATGARPVAPGVPAPADGAAGPLMLRTMDDACRLRAVLERAACRKVLVAGTSMVALKVAEACLDQGVQPTLVGRGPRILRGSAHPRVAQLFAQMLVERGVTLRLAREISAVKGDPERGGFDVVLDDGSRERVDALVAAQGTAPNIGFAAGALAVDKGIVVDDFMRASAPDVFAAGDVAQARDLLTGENVVRGLWACAVRQGRCAGRAMADELAGRPPRARYAGSIPENTIHVRDILFASAGALACGPVRRFDVCERAGAAVVRAFDMHGGCERLCGFNVLAAADGETGALADEIGLLRREVLESLRAPHRA